PAVGAQFNRTDQGVGHKQNENHPVSHGAAGEDTDRSDNANPRSPGNVFPSGLGEECNAGEASEDGTGRVPQEERNQPADYQRANDAHVLEHIAEFQSLLRSLRLRHVLTEEHNSVNRRGNEEEAKKDFPMNELTEYSTDRAADNPDG